MRSFIFTLIAAWLASVAVAQEVAPQKTAQTPLTPYRVVHSFPHDTGAFTQGLLFYDGALYEGTGHYTKSRIRRVDIGSGRVLKEWAFPDQLFGEGLTLIGNHLFGLSWRSGVGVVLDRDSLKLLGYWRYEGQGWGLTDDGNNLYMTDGSDRIYVRSPSNFRVVRTIDVKDQGVPIVRLNELEWINGEIWANVWKENRIARIDPKTGKVKSWLDLSDLARKTKGADNRDNVLNGIAYDGRTGHVFVTGKYWPSLYALEVKGLKPAVVKTAAPQKQSAKKPHE